MKKKQSLKLPSFLRPAWLSALFLGVGLGTASQRIPEIRAYTDKVIAQAEKQTAFYQRPIKGRFQNLAPMRSKAKIQLLSE